MCIKRHIEATTKNACCSDENWTATFGLQDRSCTKDNSCKLDSFDSFNVPVIDNKNFGSNEVARPAVDDFWKTTQFRSIFEAYRNFRPYWVSPCHTLSCALTVVCDIIWVSGISSFAFYKCYIKWSDVFFSIEIAVASIQRGLHLV